jgi:hypothetical protein
MSLEARAMKQFIAMLVMSLLQFGCASTPAPDPLQDTIQKPYAVAPENASLYIYRKQSATADMRMDVRLDGTPLGHTDAMTYLHTPVAPGKHVISSSAENTDRLEVEIEAGATVYLRQEVESWAESPQVRFYLAGEEEGRSGVMEAIPAKSQTTTQDIKVHVSADDPVWAGPLECQVSNSFGVWSFAATGSVTVQSAYSPLHIICNVPPGSEMETSATAPGRNEKLEAGVRRGAGAGATVGAGAGLAAGLAAAPVMGPVFAIVLAVGSAFQGAELGGVIGAVTTGELKADENLRYPSPIAIHIRRMSEEN